MVSRLTECERLKYQILNDVYVSMIRRSGSCRLGRLWGLEDCRLNLVPALPPTHYVIFEVISLE